MKYPRKGLLPGTILILVGIFIILIQLDIVSGEGFLLLLGIIFMLSYFIKQRISFLIPGAILSCLGIAVLLVNAKAINGIPEETLYMLFLSLSFFFIHVIGFSKTGNWPLVPGIVFLCITGLVYGIEYSIFTPQLLAEVQMFWPLILVIVGGIIMFRGFFQKKI